MNDFFIGYLPHMPSALGPLVKRAAVALVLLGLALALLLVAGQSPFAESTFAYGQVRQYTGRFDVWPYPMLHAPQGRFLLVAPGKHGLVLPFDQTIVTLSGTVARRGKDQLLEVIPSSVTPHHAAPAEPTRDLGSVELAGEIVDSKCYLGVMNPGQGKVHRDCATRCISGGVPPALLVDGRVVLLVAERRAILPLIGQPVQVQGRLQKRGEQFVLTASNVVQLSR